MAEGASPPTSIRRTAFCLWVSAFLALLATLLQVTGIVSSVASPGITLAIGLLTAGLLALVAAKVNTGRGWARWLFLVLYVIGVPFAALIFLGAPQTFRALPALLQINVVAQSVLQTAAVAFMYTATSRAWFRSARASTAP